MLNMEQGVIWGFRLLLNREPDSEEAVSRLASLDLGIDGLRRAFLDSPEYAQRFQLAGKTSGIEPITVDLREGIVWAYRLLLGREASLEHVDLQLRTIRSVDEIRSMFLGSPEFESIDGLGALDLRDVRTLAQFKPFCVEPAPQGWFHDFLGGKTRVSYLPASYLSKSGTVEGPPGTANAGMHAKSEWVGTLRSVLEAKDKLVAVELGLGWAPWLVSCAIAAKKRGITDIRLVGVEASPEHVGFSKQHLTDNGIDPAKHTIIRAVVGAEDGVALFPKLLDPSDHYGANAAFDSNDAVAGAGLGHWEEVPSVSLETLFRNFDVVDILHCDIQGAEGRVFKKSIGRVNEVVRRVVIGTHTRLIEGEMFDLFSANGWKLEYELPCRMIQLADHSLAVIADGEQVWRNTRF